MRVPRGLTVIRDDEGAEASVIGVAVDIHWAPTNRAETVVKAEALFKATELVRLNRPNILLYANDLGRKKIGG